MSKSPKSGNRIPFEDIAEVDRWNLPSMDDNPSVVPSAEREDQLKGRSHREKIEEVSGRVKVKPLTAEELKQIADDAEKEGYQQGYEKGLKKGLKDGSERGQQQGEQKAYEEKGKALEEETLRLRSIADALFVPMDKQDEALESILLEIVTQLTRNLLSAELSSDPGISRTLIQRALTVLPVGAKNISVYLHPEDVHALKELNIEQNEWRLLEDDTISRGGCRVETAESLVDFSVEKRINEFLQSMQAHNTSSQDCETVGDVEDIADEPIEQSVSNESGTPAK